MKKQLSALGLGLSMLSSVIGFSQENKKIIPCYTYEAMEERFAKDPEARKSYEAQQAQLQESYLQMENSQNKMAAAPVITVPVVFHILHQGGSENVSEQTCINALKWVNDDLARAHADASLTAAPFSSLYINADIKLMLAKKDPNGNCTSGIVRHEDPKANWSQGAASSGAYWTYTWPPNRYLNIYVVAQIVPQGTVAGGGIIVGYTYKPGTWPTGDNHDAIVYRSSYLNGSNARSLTHEVGHWFNLAHIWGNTNAPNVACGDDGIADTPPTKGHEFNCPSSLSGNPCAGSGGIDNVQNIMNYASCSINFTSGQVTAMRNALASGASGRNNLSSAGNLTFTGIDDTTPCAPTANFLSTTNQYTVCSGGSLIMKDASYNGTVSTYAWSGTGSVNISAPTTSMTAVVFPLPGISVITMTASNAQGSSVASKTVTVIDGTAGVPNNYYESFETAASYSNWTIVNPVPSSLAWAPTTLGYSHGSTSFYIDGPSNPPSHIDYLQMPIINLLDNPNDTIFKFKYAYARQSANHNDKFEVQASGNCGSSWTTVISLNAATMANGSGGVSGAPYMPQPHEWKTVDIYNQPQFLSFTSNKSVMVRFMFQEDVAGFGNRFFLDEVSFASTPVGVNELTKSIAFSLAPNPSSGEAVLKFNLHDPANIKVDVLDVMGKKVLESSEGNFGAGEQHIYINKGSTLSKGIYFVNMSYNGAKMCRKLIIQ